MTHHYIPFANSVTDWPLIASSYAEAAGCRAALQSLGNAQPPLSKKLWVDGGVDGLHSARINEPDDKTNPAYKDYIRRFKNSSLIADPTFQHKPDKSATALFVCAILDKALGVAANASWLSVPQLPYSDSSDRKRINRQLAEATSEWKSKTQYRGKLILPVIFGKSGLTDKKMDRNPKVDLASTCFEASGADGVWTVDSGLDDQDGVANFENVRFPGIIKFHEELNAKLPPDTVTVAGPYWGLNLVLWARGLVRFPAIGVGRSYRYYLPGGVQKEGSPRVALAPLRRLAVWSPGLKTWLQAALNTLSRNDPAHADFSALLRNFDLFNEREHARRQVAKFYHDWLAKLESIPPSSRALALYQDLSAAYVLGMGLKPLPASEKVKNPARIAKQLMVNCL
jgi:hypothetical protein